MLPNGLELSKILRSQQAEVPPKVPRPRAGCFLREAASSHSSASRTSCARFARSHGQSKTQHLRFWAGVVALSPHLRCGAGVQGSSEVLGAAKRVDRQHHRNKANAVLFLLRPGGAERYFADIAPPYLAEGGQVQPVLGGAHSLGPFSARSIS